MENTPQYRSFFVENTNEENRTVELSFSSTEPYLRSFGYEILSHDDTAIDLTRLKNKAPLLLDHDMTRQIGVVENVYIDKSTDKGRATVRFSKSKQADEIFQDVIDGIRTNISVGYSVTSMKQTSDINQTKTYIVDKWQPFEISVVSVPADISVGVGRSAEIQEISEEEIKEVLEEIPTKLEEEINQEILENDINKNNSLEENDNGLEDEHDGNHEVNKDEKEIMEIAERFGKVEEAKIYVAENKTANEFKKLVINNFEKNTKTINTRTKQMENIQTIGLSENEVKKYSLSNAIRAALTDDWREAGFEKEVSDAIAAKSGRAATSFYVPMEYMTATRTNTVANSGSLVGTDYMANSFIDLLRNKSLMFNAGAQLMTGLQGNIVIPKQTGGTTAYWVAENEDVTASTPTFGTVTMTPKTVGAMASYSRQMLLQGNPSIENLIMNDLMSSMALEIDRAVIAGTGANGQPKGILNTAGIATVDCSAGLTYAKIVEFETAIADQNYDLNNLKFITNPTIMGELKTTVKEAGNPTYLLENGKANGYDVLATKQIGAGTAIFGDFSNVLVGAWGGLDLNIDKFTNAQNGSVRIVGLQSVDVAIRRPQAFAISTNI